MNLKKFYEKEHTEINLEGNKKLKIPERGLKLFNLAGKPKEKKILDLGCQFGDVTKHFVKNNDVTIVDFNKNAVEFMIKTYNVKGIQAGFDGEDLPLKDNSFDVIEHLFYYEEIVRECKRVLKPKGIFVGSTPNAFNLRARIGFLLNKPGKAFNYEHIRFFNEKILRRTLKKEFNFIKLIGFKGLLKNISINLFAHIFLWVCQNEK